MGENIEVSCSLGEIHQLEGDNIPQAIRKKT